MSTDDEGHAYGMLYPLVVCKTNGGPWAEHPDAWTPGRHVTPTVGHVGYPDLTLCRGGRLVLLELKSRRGTTTPSQDLWRDRLEQVPGVEYHVLWPEAWPHKVTRVLV